MSAVIAALAEYRARKQVKEELRRKGLKVSDCSAAEIKVMAGVWAEMHRDELIADAKRMIASSPELKRMYEKEQRQLRAKIEINRLRARRLLHCRTPSASGKFWRR
jgi:hypothetical protein